MIKNKNKTTARDFEVFKKECELWVERFGLKDWDIVYKHQQIEYMGSTVWDRQDRCADIILSTDFYSVKVTDFELKSTAFHEIFELILADLFTLACQRSTTSEELHAARHAIIQRMLNYIFKKDYDSRQNAKTGHHR